MIRRGTTRLVGRLGDLLAELRRRRVYQVTALYVVLAGGALEVLDIVVPQTGLPAWTVRAFLWAGAGGLPLVVALAWIHDVTPQGVRRSADPGGGVEGAPSRGREPGRLDPNTVAVLPFENLSGAVEAEPLVVGLHDDLLTELSRASALQVISGTSVRAFRRVRLNIQFVDGHTARSTLPGGSRLPGRGAPGGRRASGGPR